MTKSISRGSWVGIGIGVGAALYVATNEPVD
jgi:hypothetical protein